MTTETAALPQPREAVRALVAGAVAMRRDLHRNAELSTEEHRTQRVILDRLHALGLDDVRAIANTGATALVRGGRPGENLLWRADIDALPLVEETGLPFACETGATHACGHDGHVAIALALAEALQQRRESLAGSVRFAFQPAEEHVGGARRMIDEGVLDDPPVDRIFALHIWAAAPVGDLIVQPGPIFAAATHFRIIVRGSGGHAAAPQETRDPIVAAAHLIVGLQTIVSRNVDPRETAVVTVGRLQGGNRGNIIPNEVMMSGTVRTYDARVLERVLRRMDEIASGVTEAFGCQYRFDHSTLGACINDEGSADLVRKVAAGFLGEQRVREQRATGADDMCHFLAARPGAYFLLGAAPRGADVVYPHHHPKFDFDEECIGPGIELALRVIEAASGSAAA